MMAQNRIDEPSVVDDSFASPSFDECEHLHMLGRVGANGNKPAFGVDFGELNYRVLGRLIRLGLVKKARAYRYGENRTRTGYWLSAAGWRFIDGGAKQPSTEEAATTT